MNKLNETNTALELEIQNSQNNNDLMPYLLKREQKPRFATKLLIIFFNV